MGPESVSCRAPTIPPSLKAGKVWDRLRRSGLANNVTEGVRTARADVGEDGIAMG